MHCALTATLSLKLVLLVSKPADNRSSSSVAFFEQILLSRHASSELPSGSSHATAKTVWGFVGTVETALGTVLGTVVKTIGTVGTVN